MGDQYDKDFYSRNLNFQRALAAPLVPWIIKNLKYNSVADFGCGCGYLLSQLSKGKRDFIGINYNVPENLQFDKSHFMSADFTREVILNLKYDLVVSLEVAEHIPEASADTFIFSLVSAASKYIMFSAATPGQGGVDHVNEQPHEYWHEKFIKHGFMACDEIRPVLAGNKSVPFWYRNNIFLYER